MKSLKSLALGLLAAAGVASGSLMAAGSTYYLNDHLATTIGTADAAGEIAALEADAFGSPVAGSAAGRYTGKPYDSDMGAYVFPFRNYRAQEARWMSNDPSGFPDGVNSQAYLADMNSIDPLGLYSFSITITDLTPADGSEFNTTVSPGNYYSISHTAKIKITGTRTANEAAIVSGGVALRVTIGNSVYSNAVSQTPLSFGTKLTESWDLSLGDGGIVQFARTKSNEGNYTATVYAQVFKSDQSAALSTQTSKSTNYRLNIE